MALPNLLDTYGIAAPSRASGGLPDLVGKYANEPKTPAPAAKPNILQTAAGIALNPKVTNIASYLKSVSDQWNAGQAQINQPFINKGEQKTPVTQLQALEGSLNVGAGVLTKLTAPAAPLFSAIGKLINDAGAQLANTPYLQGYGKDMANAPAGTPGLDTPDRILQAIQNFSVVGSAVVGGLEGLKGKEVPVEPTKLVVTHGEANPIPIHIEPLPVENAPTVVREPETLPGTKTESISIPEGIKLYRADSNVFDPNKVKNGGYTPGTYFATNDKYANDYNVGGKRPVTEYALDPNAKVLLYKDLPENLKKSETLTSNSINESKDIYNYAKSNGYDAVESEIPSKVNPTRNEITVINPAVVKIPKSRTTTQTLKPIEGTGDIKTRGLSQGVEATAIEKQLTDTFGDLPEYQQVSMKEQAQTAADYLASKPDEAMAVALGNKAPPKGLLPESVFVAVEQKAIAEGDVQGLRDLANSKLAGSATTMGQRIRTLGERDSASPLSAIREVQDARAKAQASRGQTVDTEVAKAQKVIRQTNTKQSWSSFVESLTC